MDKTSASLLERLRGPRDAEALKRFVQLYTPLLLCWARRLGQQEQDAADLVQDVLAVLVQKLPTFAYDERQRFRGWLWTIMRHRLLTLRRRDVSAAHANAELARPIEQTIEQPMEEEEYRAYITRRAAELLRQVFEEKTWRAFWQNVGEGRSAAEVAQESGLSLGAVYAAKSRVLHRLRQELAGLLD